MIAPALLLSIATFGLFACSSGEKGGPADAEPSAPLPTITVGAVLATSGPASFIGKPEANTLRMLVEEANAKGGWRGREIAIQILDSKGDKSKAVAHVETLMAGGAVAVIGPSTSGESLAVRDLAEAHEVPLISLAASHKIVEGTPPWVFKTAQSDSLAVEVVYKDIRRRGLTNIAILYSTEGFGLSGYRELERLADDHNIRIVGTDSFAREDSEFSGALNGLIAAKPEALVVWGTLPGPAEATKTARTIGFSGPIYQSHGSASDSYVELAGQAAEGVRLPASKLLALDALPDDDPQRPALESYRDQYMAAYGEKPSHFGGHAWDAFHLLEAAVRAGGAEPSAIRKELEAGREWAGATGVFNWTQADHEGLDSSSFVLVEIKDGKWTRASEPTDSTTGNQ